MWVEVPLDLLQVAVEVVGCNVLGHLDARNRVELALTRNVAVLHLENLDVGALGLVAFTAVPEQDSNIHSQTQTDSS